MKKTVISIILATLFVFICGFGCGGPSKREDISYLYVRTYEGGFGDKYLNDIKTDFEQRYANESFADGKTGVILDIRSSPDIGGKTMLGKIKNDKTTQVYIMEALYYSQFTETNLLYDLTSIVKEDLADNSGSIESKLYSDQKASLTAVDGKYYALPTFAGLSGITYNAQLFEDKFLYFADDIEDAYFPSTTSSYTGKDYTGRGFVQYPGQVKSCGPNGIYEDGLGDDGLPSSYEEFFYLFDYMITPSKDITPIIWSGDATHYTNYVYQALISASSTKTEFLTRFNFDSGDETVRLVENFNGEEPNVVNAKITPEEGYKVRQMYPDYLALKFMEHLFKNQGEPAYYDSRSVDLGLSNTAAQKLYINSTLNDRVKDIACLIEGAYWYNEAAKDVQDAANSYGALGTNIDFRYMPMPAVEYGTVNENDGTKGCLADAFYYYLGVNNNIEGDEELEKLVKAFVKFFYEKENLAKVTASTGIPLAVKYDLSQNQYNDMDKFQQSLWDNYKTALTNDMYVTPLSTSKIFLNNVPRFTFKTTGYAFDSVLNGANVSLPQKQFYNAKATAKTYFEGMVETIKGTWNTTYYTTGK